MRTAFLVILCLGLPVAFGSAPCVPAFAEAPAGMQDASCPECKAKIKADAKFCPSCGAKIVQQTCAECKAPLKPGAKFCPSCGAKVADAPAPKAEPEPGKKPPENQEAAKPDRKSVV